jgi:hypothetical protein
MVVAERLQAGEHLVDLGFLADEGRERGFLVPARLLGAEFVARGGDRVQAGRHRGGSVVSCIASWEWTFALAGEAYQLDKHMI